VIKGKTARPPVKHSQDLRLQTVQHPDGRLRTRVIFHRNRSDGVDLVPHAFAGSGTESYTKQAVEPVVTFISSLKTRGGANAARAVAVGLRKTGVRDINIRSIIGAERETNIKRETAIAKHGDPVSRSYTGKERGIDLRPDEGTAGDSCDDLGAERATRNNRSVNLLSTCGKSADELGRECVKSHTPTVGEGMPQLAVETSNSPRGRVASTSQKGVLMLDDAAMFDHRIPARDECVLGHLLERWAEVKPDDIALIFQNGPTWTWRETLERTRQTAKALADLGVVKGDHVLSWQPNGPDAVLTWFGLNYLGAVYVPLNTAYKSGILEHQVRISDARLIICHTDLATRLNDIDTASLTDIVIVGTDKVDAIEVSELTTHPASTLTPLTGLTEMPESVEPWDTQYIIFTSGTTGPSKAVLSSYLQGYSMGTEAHPRFNDNDRILVNLPLFHVGGTVFLNITLATGGSCVVDTHFRTNEFWSTVNDHNITAVCLLAAMVPFLLNLPEFEGEHDHPLRTTVIVPWTEEAMRVAERYNLDALTTFNMTEVSSPLMSDLHPNIPGLCGKARPGIEARVVDENDCEVAPGQTGELILRSDRPWAMNHGYYKNPEATANAWRNGWFHTGDGFRYDEEGNFFFVDRIKDAIRRRGENISSFEVENEVVTHPDIAEAAAIPVPSQLGEDDVMIVVAPVDGANIDSKELFEFLEPRMAHFMLPRYIRVIGELPKTPTQKVQKHLLKSDGVTADTWDREDAGIEIKRERIG